LEKKIQTKDEVPPELMAEHVALRNAWGTLTGAWVPHDTRPAAGICGMLVGLAGAARVLA
jgi:hypothetical protein